MAKRPTFESLAGHHPECSHPFNWCTCSKLYERDAMESMDDEIESMWFLNETEGWPYADDD